MIIGFEKYYRLGEPRVLVWIDGFTYVRERIYNLDTSAKIYDTGRLEPL